MAQKKGEWSKPVTTQIKNNMEESARAAYLNGCALCDDARLLFDAERFARSAALAILAEEEFSKAFILLICVGQGRWDSSIYQALRKHPEKQGVAEGMRIHFDWFLQNYKQVMEMNRFSPVEAQPTVIPSDEKVNEIIQKAKNNFSKPIRDYLKQDALYVSLNEDAKVGSGPSAVGREDAQRCLDESTKFRVITEVLLGDPTGAVKWAGL